MKYLLFLFIIGSLSACQEELIRVLNTSKLSEENSKRLLNNPSRITLKTSLASSEKYIIPYLKGKKVSWLIWQASNNKTIDTSFFLQIPLAKNLAFQLQFHPKLEGSDIKDTIVYDFNSLNCIYSNISPQTLMIIFNNQAKKFFSDIIPHIQNYTRLKDIFILYTGITPSDETNLKAYRDFNKALTPQQIRKIRSYYCHNIGGVDTLPTIFFSMKNLESFQFNKGELKHIPADISKLKKLKSLSFCQHNLSSLPNSLKNLTKLKSLDLSYNNFEKFPDFFLHLTQLEELDLQYNRLQKIPKGITQLKKLKRLLLYNNPLSAIEIENLKKELPNTEIIFY